MTDRPRISVVTVCFNSAATLEATLLSIERQGYKNVEHIVVDGGSTDGTLELIERWPGHRVVLLRGPDRGMYDAMNKGIARTSGDVIGFLNADDRYAADDVLELIADAMADRDVDCVQGDLTLVDGQTRQLRRYWQSKAFSRWSFRFGWLPPHPTLYVRRSLAVSVGPFNLVYRVAADIEWMMRLLSRTPLRMRYVPRVLVEMNAGGASNAGIGAFLRANAEVWKACRLTKLWPTAFVLGKTMRKLPQWMRLRPHAEP